VQRDLTELENRLWDAADELRANSKLKASEYGAPVLGLIFLRFGRAPQRRRNAEVTYRCLQRPESADIR
jgi:type I restriction enzyme M protein